MTSLSHLHHLAWDFKHGKGEPGSVCVCGRGGVGRGVAVHKGQRPSKFPPLNTFPDKMAATPLLQRSAEVNSPRVRVTLEDDICPLGDAGFPEYQKGWKSCRYPSGFTPGSSIVKTDENYPVIEGSPVKTSVDPGVNRKSMERDHSTQKR